MTNILGCLLQKIAIYWPKGPVGTSGLRDYSLVTPIEVPVHWVDRAIESIDIDGEMFITASVINTSTRLEIRGVLFLTTATINDPVGTGLLTIPSKVPLKNIIQRVETHPDIEASETLYKVMI